LIVRLSQVAGDMDLLGAENRSPLGSHGDGPWRKNQSQIGHPRETSFGGTNAEEGK